jgi:hypothetical protein
MKFYYKLYKASFTVLVNIIVFITLMMTVELAYRIYRFGLHRTFSFSSSSHSNLELSNWVVEDRELGYRLNPRHDGYNSLSIRYGEIVIPKPKGLYRLMFLGDSVPWDNPGFVNYTESFLNSGKKFEVINASVPGYTSYQEVLLYTKYLVSTNPDLVIWTYCLNDNHRFLHEFNEQAQMLTTREAKLALIEASNWDKFISHSYLLTDLRLRLFYWNKQHKQKNSEKDYIWENQPDFNTAWKDNSWIDYERHFLTLKKVLDKQGTKLGIIIFPYEPQLSYRHNSESYDYVVKPQRKLMTLCKQNHVPCLDLFSAFSNEYDKGKVFYRDGIHLNQEGHKFTAQKIYQFLSQHALLK